MLQNNIIKHINAKINSHLYYKIAFTFLLGALYSFTFAPYNIFICIFIAFFFLIITIKNSKNFKQTLLFIYSFNLGFCIFNFYWVWYSISYMFFDPALKILLFFGGSILYCIFFLPLLLLKSKQDYSFLFIIKIILALSLHELLKNYLVGGMPWPIAAQIWDFSLYMLQGVALYGSIGFSLITWCLVASLFFLLLKTNIKVKAILMAPALAIVLFVLIYGIYRVNYYNNRDNIAILSNINFRIISTAIDQDLKYSNSKIQNFYDITEISFEKLNEKNLPDYILFPEVAFGFSINPNDKYFNFFASHIPSKSTVLLGALREEDAKYYNSIYAISGENKNIINLYDKINLVPFGEYIPFVDIIPYINKIVDTSLLSKGSEQTIFNINNVIFSALICFEVAFFNKNLNSNNIDWLFIASNEAWFNYSNELYQFISLLKIRSIEGGVYTIKSSNKGFSSIINPLGEIEFLMKATHNAFYDTNLLIYKIKQHYTLYLFFITLLIITCYYLFFVVYKKLTRS
jgi:apolipoprotein N-acyltransferase